MQPRGLHVLARHWPNHATSSPRAPQSIYWKSIFIFIFYLYFYITYLPPCVGKRVSRPQSRSDWLWGPPSFLVCGYRLFYSAVERLGCEVGQSPPPSAEVKSEWSYTSAIPIRLHGMYEESYFFFTIPRPSKCFRSLWFPNQKPVCITTVPCTWHFPHYYHYLLTLISSTA
jgi:hypothetical protein